MADAPLAAPLICGIGHATVDFLGTVPRYPGPDSKTPLHQVSIQGGGPVATALVAARALGCRARLAAKVVAPRGEAEDSLVELQEMGPRDVIITLGDAGSLGLSGDAAAALKCRSLGGRAGIPDLDEVLAFLGWSTELR